MFRMIFITVAISVFLFMNFYAYRRFLSKIDIFLKYKRFFKILVVAIFLAELLYFALLSSGKIGTFYIFFSSLIGISFILFIVALVYDFLHIFIKKMPFDESRRVALKMIFDVTMLIFALSYMIKGFVNGFKYPAINKVSIKIKNLKKPISIVHLSDIHLGKSIKKDFLERIVKSVNSSNPDIVVITGDLIDLKVKDIEDNLDPLRDISSKYGTYFVLGNHEYFHGPYAIKSYIKSLGVKVLENESLVIGENINLLGVYDISGYRFGYLKPDLSKALLKSDPNLPNILLSHQPKIVKYMRNEPIDLILSGHTHGGQIFPFGLLVLLDQPYLGGLYKHNEKTKVFVNKGAGYWGPPVRVLAQNEIVKIELIPE